MSAGQRMLPNHAVAESVHGRHHLWSLGCEGTPVCEPEPVLDRIAREVKAEALTASIALIRRHIAHGLDIQAGDEEWAFKVGALGATLRIVDEALAALVARIEG